MPGDGGIPNLFPLPTPEVANSTRNDGDGSPQFRWRIHTLIKQHSLDRHDNLC